MSTPYATFEPGSVVFEPFLGLCRVTHSSQETMLGVEQLFYQLQPRQGSAVVKVPASQMVSRGIRPLLTVDQIEFKLRSESEHLPQDDTETRSQRLHRWTRLVRSEHDSGSYDFLREWHQLITQGGRFGVQENEMYGKIHRSLTQEISDVLQISSGRATIKLNQWLEPTKNVNEKKMKC